MLKIAFGYKKGSGKDTACEFLIQKHGGQRLAFADALKDIMHYAQNVCGFDQEKDRHFLQYIGTHWARAKNPNVWVDIVEKQIITITNNIFISDLRFENEAAMLRKHGFILIQIQRNVESDNHVSETELDNFDWDYSISNNGTLDEFYVLLDNLKDATQKK